MASFASPDLSLVSGCWMVARGHVAAWKRQEEGAHGVEAVASVLQMFPLLVPSGFRLDPVGELARSSAMSLADRFLEPTNLRLLRFALAAHDETVGRLQAAFGIVRLVRDDIRKRRDAWRKEALESVSCEEGLAGAADAADEISQGVFDFWMMGHRLQSAAFEDRETLRLAVAEWESDRKREWFPALVAAPAEVEA